MRWLLLLLLLAGCASEPSPPELPWKRVAWHSITQIWDRDPIVEEAEVLADGRVRLGSSPVSGPSTQPRYQERWMTLNEEQTRCFQGLLRRVEEGRRLPQPELSASTPDLQVSKDERRSILLECRPASGPSWWILRAQIGTATAPDLKRTLEEVDRFFFDLHCPKPWMSPAEARKLMGR